MPGRSKLPQICVALGIKESEQLLAQARAEIHNGERFLEFRVDYLRNPAAGAKVIRDLVKEFPEVSILATCRRHQNHGKFNGSIDEQIQILEAAVDAGAVAVDVEIESCEDIKAHLERFRGRATVVVSYHNFEGTPPVEAILKRMQKVDADVYKIVTTARKPSDCQRMLSLGRAHAKESLVLLAMGETGFPTRVLSPSFGAIYTYAAPSTANGTAAGQVTAKLLRNLYRIDKFTRNAKIYGVIADPVLHSISPAVHNRAFQSKRIDAVYLPFLVHPPQLKDFFALAESLPIAGFSVTIPHKQKVMRYLDVVDPLSRRIGAVNTVWRKGGKWRGTNTDVDGIVGPLGKKLKIGKSSILLVGNGGAARGAAFSLADAGAKVSITGRNPDRVRALAKAAGAEPLLRTQIEGLHFDAVVHATPMGMHPHLDDCFFDGKIPGEVVFDMVYNPLETVLVKRAKAQGCGIVPGFQMFLEQAAKQFEIWTADSPPRAVMEKAALEALGHHPTP